MRRTFSAALMRASSQLAKRQMSTTMETTIVDKAKKDAMAAIKKDPDWAARAANKVQEAAKAAMKMQK